MPRNQCHLASGSDLSDTEMISKWHVKDYVQQFQYNTQDVRYHFNHPFSQKKGEKAQAQCILKAALKTKENRETGLIHKKGLDCPF